MRPLDKENRARIRGWDLAGGEALAGVTAGEEWENAGDAADGGLMANLSFVVSLM